MPSFLLIIVAILATLSGRSGNTSPLSVAGAAEWLGVSTKTVRRMIASGELAGYRVRNKVIRIEVADLEKALKRIPAVDKTS